jgi:ribonuclease R
MLVGRRSGRQFRIGDKLTIRVVAANLTKRQLDYEWVITAPEALETPAPAQRKPRAPHHDSKPAHRKLADTHRPAPRKSGHHGASKKKK